MNNQPIQDLVAPSLVPPKSSFLDGKSAAERKQYPIFEGVYGYFRDALQRVAHVSYIGNEQHNPGQPLHWARGKSKDQRDCIARHLSEYDPNDFSAETEAALFSMIWRALAEGQMYLERKYNIKPPVNARSDT